MRHIKLVMLLFILFGGSSCNNSANPVIEQPKKENSSDSQKNAKRKVILFFGNSITAGYGLDINNAFTTLIQTRLDSLNKPYQAINAGVSGETTASGNSRVDWVLEKQHVDIFVLELGANDGLRGLPLQETQKNLSSIIDKVRKTYPDVKIILAGMMLPPSMGPEYTNTFQKIFPEIAHSKNVKLIPFILNNVAGIDTLNQSDGIHPNIEGEKIVMENIWGVLKDEL